jgi:hypothetical protein
VLAVLKRTLRSPTLARPAGQALDIRGRRSDSFTALYEQAGRPFPRGRVATFPPRQDGTQHTLDAMGAPITYVLTRSKMNSNGLATNLPATLQAASTRSSDRSGRYPIGQIVTCSTAGDTLPVIPCLARRRL